jgi:hypothetical protein
MASFTSAVVEMRRALNVTAEVVEFVKSVTIGDTSVCVRVVVKRS